MKQLYLFVVICSISVLGFSQTPLNYYGLNFTTGQLRMAEVNVSNGALNIINQSPTSPDQFESGVCDIDPINNRYFYVRGGAIYTVDISTGNVLHSAGITSSAPINASAPFTNLAYNWRDSTLYGLQRYGGWMWLASLNPTTGVSTVISQTATSQAMYQSGVADLDPFNRRYFYVNSNRLLSIDLDDGSVITNAFLFNPNGAVAPITNIAYNWITQKIYGLNFKAGANWGPGELRLAEVDPTTGMVTIINETILSADHFLSGDSDINPINNTYTYHRGSGGSSQIITVDLATGNIVHSPLIQNPNNAIAPILNIVCPYKVDVAPPPSASFQITPHDLTIDLKDQSPYAANFFWDFGDGTTHTAQHPSHTYTSPGTYTVRLVVNNVTGFDTLEQTVEVEAVATSAAPALADEWSLGPNPSSGDFQLYAPESVGSARQVLVSVADVQGKVVFEQIGGFEIGPNPIALPAVSPGTYLVRIQQDEQVEVKRLVVSFSPK